MIAKGRALEMSIARAAARYLREGRAGLRRQHLPTVTGRDGFLQPSGDAPIDFLGCTGPNEAQYVAGRMLAIECKETAGKSLGFGDAGLREDQRSALAAVHALGAITLVVVEFTSLAEVYAVTWPRIAEFLAAPWRKSLPLEWFRAYGLVLPEEGRESGRARRTLFLDGKEHWAREHALSAIETERLTSPVVSLERPDDVLVPTPSVYAGLSKDQIAERIRAATSDGITRQMSAAKRSGKWRKGGAR